MLIIEKASQLNEEHDAITSEMEQELEALREQIKQKEMQAHKFQDGLEKVNN